LAVGRRCPRREATPDGPAADYAEREDSQATKIAAGEREYGAGREGDRGTQQTQVASVSSKNQIAPRIGPPVAVPG
jgi:hypothetical protein